VSLSQSFGAQVRIHRNRLNLTQVQLADMLELSEEMVGKIERGSAGASFKTIEKLCNVFEVQPSMLFPEYSIPENERQSVLSKIHIRLSRLNDTELTWVDSILDKIIRYPR